MIFLGVVSKTEWEVSLVINLNSEYLLWIFFFNVKWWENSCVFNKSKLFTHSRILFRALYLNEFQISSPIELHGNRLPFMLDEWSCSGPPSPHILFFFFLAHRLRCHHPKLLVPNEILFSGYQPLPAFLCI